MRSTTSPRDRALAKLAQARPLADADELRRLLARIATMAQGPAHAAVACACLHGRELVDTVSRMDRGQAAEVANSVAVARELADLLRRVAYLHEAAADRVAVAVEARRDRAEIAQAGRQAHTGAAP